MKQAWDLGCNYFDTAELYGYGNAEKVMGNCFKKLGWERKDFVLSTKIWKVGDGVNDGFLSRKHVIEGINGCLKRLQMDYVDVVFASRPDLQTPMEETCRTFDWIIRNNKSFYWGTSMWSPADIMEANECCERLGLIKPVIEQCEYSMLIRNNVEFQLPFLFDKYGMGTTIWSPLAGGYLTGKYNDNLEPEGARYKESEEKMPDFLLKALNKLYLGEDRLAVQKKFVELGKFAEELGYTQSQLSLAWAIVNKDVSVCLLGATKESHIVENMKSIELCKKWTPEIEERIEKILTNESPFDWRTWTPLPPRRKTQVEFAEKKE